MCGFAGIVSWDQKHRVHRDVLERMSARIAHRGPDDQGLWINHEADVTPDNPQVGLAFRRLSIIDLDPRANQPFTNGRGQWLVFNGEIYNYRELRKELEKLLPDYQWRTTGDGEVLLAGYAAWGEKCVEHLNGMFAFAVWDQNKRELFLARDRMGQKPLYVACDPLVERLEGASPTGFAFASELAALRDVAWVGRAINSSALDVYLSLGYIPNGTIHRGVMKLDPAKTLTLNARSARENHYFRPYASFGESTPDDGVSLPGMTRLMVREAVARQLVADVPLGCFLSGGVDSSVVAAAMKAAVAPDQPVLTFSIGFDDPRYDESAFASEVAKHLGTRHHQFKVNPDAAAELPKLAAVFGEPFGDSSALPVHYLSRETRRHVKVALSGDGGDELFGGYDRYRALALTEKLAGVGRPLVKAASGTFGKLIPGTHPKSRGARLKRLLASAHLSPARRYATYMRIFSPEQVHELAWPDAEPRSDYDNLIQLFEVGMGARPVVPNALAVDRVSYLPEDLLTKIDRCSMLHALEVRSPFMDHELVSFAATLTTKQLLKGGPKRMLREAFADVLPSWVFKRKKMGFAVPIGEWFRGQLRPMLRGHLFAGDSFAKAHFNMPVVQRLVDEHETERVDHSQRLYALLMLELWWKTQKT